MKRDLLNNQDVFRFVRTFHTRLRADNLLGPLFEIHVKNWETFESVMCAFWENIIFFSGNYTGNPMDTHLRIHRQTPLEIQHFLRWNMVLNDTIDAMYSGNNAELVKSRAQSISAIIQLKLLKSESPDFHPGL